MKELLAPPVEAQVMLESGPCPLSPHLQNPSALGHAHKALGSAVTITGRCSPRPSC